MTKIEGSKKYYWVPCTGSKDTNPPNPPGHVGIVREGDANDENHEIGKWITWNVALKTYHEVIRSSGQTHCPICSAVWDTI